MAQHFTAALSAALPLVAAAFVLCAISSVAGQTTFPVCSQLNETSCMQTAYCSWDFACSTCFHVPCDYFAQQTDCNPSYCQWNSTLSACYNTTVDCTQRPTQSTCAEDSSCTWHPLYAFCQTTEDYCGSYVAQAACQAEPQCMVVDSNCYKRMPLDDMPCEDIRSANYCLYRGCRYEANTGQCFTDQGGLQCSLLSEEPCATFYDDMCEWHDSLGCISYDHCGNLTLMDIWVSVNFLSQLFQEYHIYGTIFDPFSWHAPNLTIIGNVSVTSQGLVLDGGCLEMPAQKAFAQHKGASIRLHVDDSIANQTHEAVVVDFPSKNGHSLVVSVGPGNRLTIFGRRAGVVTVIATAENVLAGGVFEFAVAAGHMVVFVNDEAVLIRAWSAGLRHFDGSFRVGCSVTDDNWLRVTIPEMDLFTAVTNHFYNVTHTQNLGSHSDLGMDSNDGSDNHTNDNSTNSTHGMSSSLVVGLMFGVGCIALVALVAGAMRLNRSYRRYRRRNGQDQSSADLDAHIIPVAETSMKMIMSTA
eukprot:m.171843 g.171843  ORF g.171843 m.171843 type:complete len:527 (-) comp16507_c3_seq3:251-1831(-)